MTKDEALRLALEALYGFIPYLPIEHDKPQCDRYDQAITGIKAALEAKDEPWEQFYPEMGKPKLAYLPPTESLENACYIPPQRTWVGLDDEDYIKAYELCDFDKVAAFEFFEAKLKAKNT